MKLNDLVDEYAFHMGILDYTKWDDIEYEQYVEDSIRRSDFEKTFLIKRLIILMLI